METVALGVQLESEALSGRPSVTSVATPDDIEIRWNYTPRVEEDSLTVDRYRDAIVSGDTFPALDVCLVEGKYVVVDGVHRLRAYQEARRVSAKDVPVQCRVIEIASPEAALLYSCQANRKNALALKVDDFRKVAEALYKANYGAPVKNLAQRLGIDARTLKKWLGPQVAQYKKEIVDKREELLAAGTSLRDAEKVLKKEFPFARGLCHSNIGRQAKKASHEKVDGQPDTSVPPLQLDAAGKTTLGKKYDSALEAPEVKVCDQRHFVVMVRKLGGIREEIRKPLVERIRQLVEEAYFQEVEVRGKEADNKTVRGTRSKKAVSSGNPFSSVAGPCDDKMAA